VDFVIQPIFISNAALGSVNKSAVLAVSSRGLAMVQWVLLIIQANFMPLVSEYPRRRRW
jgi:hypothetical protein